jgi:hypothetical protein
MVTAKINVLTDHIDLMVDEFKRIKAVTYGNKEVEGLCDRAVSNTYQHVPVIVQRDTAEALATQLATDALTSLLGIVCTPAEGYLKAPQCLANDIGNLRKLEEAATKRAESAEEGWKEALAIIDIAGLAQTVGGVVQHGWGEGVCYVITDTLSDNQFSDKQRVTVTVRPE